MPQYRVTDPRSKKTIILTGDSPPTEQELQAIFSQLNQGQEPTPPPSLVERGLSLLPMAGGVAGGIIGGIGGTVGGMGVGGIPGAVGGATLGGAGGEAFEQLIRRAMGLQTPETPLAAATSIGREGVVQGASEAAGGALMRGATGVGRMAMRKAVRPNPSLQKKFPGVDITQTLIDERARGGVTRGSRPRDPRGSHGGWPGRRQHSGGTTGADVRGRSWK